MLHCLDCRPKNHTLRHWLFPNLPNYSYTFPHLLWICLKWQNPTFYQSSTFLVRSSMRWNWMAVLWFHWCFNLSLTLSSHWGLVDKSRTASEISTALIKLVHNGQFILDWHFLRHFTIAHSLLTEGGAMLQIRDHHGRGADLRVPAIVHIAWFSQTLVFYNSMLQDRGWFKNS